MSELRRGHSKTTLIRTTPKKMHKKQSIKNLTSQKYLNAKLDFSQQKKMTMQRTIEIKNERIKQLQKQIRENQQLVSNTLDQWKRYKEEVQMKSKTDIDGMEKQMIELNKKFDTLQCQLLDKQKENKQLIGKNDKLENEKNEWKKKYESLASKYRQDKRQWKQTCILVNSLIQFIKNLPPELMNTSDLSF